MDKTLSNKKHAGAKKEKSFFVSVFMGTIIALAVGLLLLLAVCFLGLSLDDPDKFTPPLALGSLFVTALLSGYLSARKHKKSGLLCGAVSGILLTGIMVLLAFAFSLGIRLSLFAICAPAIIVCAALAGICGVGSGSVKKPKHKIKF